MSPVGPGGLVNQLTDNALETALDAELTEHLVHEHGSTAARQHDGTAIAENMRDTTRTKMVPTKISPVESEPSGTGMGRSSRDRPQTHAPAGRGRPDRIVVDRTGSDDREGHRSLRGGLRGEGLQEHDQPDHRDSHQRAHQAHPPEASKHDARADGCTAAHHTTASVTRADSIVKALKPVDTTPTKQTTKNRFEESTTE